ncbi:biotin attachment protein [Candidatus Bathyarchaeota archaeon]|nr:biotin attachment protein [Candidatus Bathyarchaeota archaeon]
MVTYVHMPNMSTLDYTMEYGIIAEWIKKEGEYVEKGEPLLTVETEKIVNEINSPASGKILKILAPEGSEVPVGEKIALIK